MNPIWTKRFLSLFPCRLLPCLLSTPMGPSYIPCQNSPPEPYIKSTNQRYSVQNRPTDTIKTQTFHIKHLAALSTLFFSFLATPLPAAPLPATTDNDDSWPRYAHDSALTGRTSLAGDILTPRQAWSLSLAGTSLDIELHPHTGNHSTDSSAAPEPPTLTPAQAPLRDIDGTGVLRPVNQSHQERWAKILPNTKGLQQIRWDQTGTTAKICHLQLLAYDQGFDKPRTVWTSEPVDTVFAPLMIVNDIDHDGQLEICIAMHYRVFIFNALTGKIETEFRFHNTRSYGWFGLADVDANGQDELIILSDFQSHFDVLDFDPTKPESERLSVRWRREIETKIDERKKWPQVGPRPVVDATGDGLPEIVVNLYNDTGDNQWHTLVLNASTGATLADLPNRYTLGNADLNNNGCAEIFCTTTDNIYVSDYGQLEILSIQNNHPLVIWQQNNSNFGQTNLPTQAPTSATGASQGMRHILLTGDTPYPAFLVLTRGKNTTISAVRFDQNDQANQLWSAELASNFPKVLALADQAESVSASIRLQLPADKEETVTGTNTKPTFVSRQPLASHASAPIAARNSSNGPMHVYVEGAAENIFAIAPPTTSNNKPQILWQQPGRGIGNQSGSPVAVDLDQDGSPEIVAATRSATGAAEITAYHADGKSYWRHTFHHTPGARPVHNVGALSYWWPGNFRSTDQTDLLINTRRGLMHSDVGHLLDGRTGKLIWTQAKAIIPDEFQWGFTGKPVAIADLSGNALDDITNLYPVCFWIAEGASGKMLNGRDLATQKVVPAWAAYGEPIISDFTGDGNKEVLLDSPYILALLNIDGTALWHGKPRASYTTGQADDNFGETTQTKHTLIDFDADGKFELASAGYKDGVRAIDAKTGKVLWSLSAPAPTGRKCAAANIDGNPGDELLYVAGNTLVAVRGDQNQGKILWTWQAQAGLSLPAIADIDNDGLAEIVVQSADGILHCIDGPEQ